MRGEAYKKLERYEEAWAILGKGMTRYPDYHELLRRRVFLAIDRSLYQTAAQLGREYLDRTPATPEDYLAIGTALFRSGSTNEALSFLELARLRFTDNPTVVMELAKIYKERSMYRTAGQLLERLAIQGHEDLAIEAAELYRQAREYYRALALNARVSDSKKRLRQRLGILLELRRYEQVAAMERDLRRVGLLEDETLRYAVAYAHFKTGDYASADRLLSGLTDSAIFRQATELRKAMEDCRGAEWRC
jgi:tetratricopeptide (TPR) repeat protein